jgi:YYY domain-containing protein
MLGVLLWWLLIQIFCVAVLPLAWSLFRFLPDRGYALAKALGLLLVSYLLWLGASFKLLPNSAGGIVFALVIVGGVSWWVGREGLRRSAHGRPGVALLDWLRNNRAMVIAVEVLFLAVLAGWAAFRAYNPDIAGTEKPMELTFMNGVLGSRFFPPQDPWLSGYGISYYYFGYVMLGLLSRLSGVTPAVSFNLGVALWCSLATIGGFGLVYDLVRLVPASHGSGRASDAAEATQGDSRTEAPPAPDTGAARGIRYGLLGSLFVVFLGNLEGVVELAYNRSLVPLSWIRWLDIKQLMDSPPTGNFTGGFWWWWHASRVIHDKDLLGNSVEVIDEFPFFSYLLGDMHPHVLGLPFVLLAIGVGLNLLIAARRHEPQDESHESKESGGLRRGLSRLWSFFCGLTGLGAAGVVCIALILGALAFLNTWDFPVYVALATLAIGAGLALREGLSWAVAGRAVAAGAVFAILGWTCYLPFYLGFQSQLGGILPNLLFPSRLIQFLLVNGIFLAVVLFYLILLSRSPKAGHGSDLGETLQPGPAGVRHSLARRFLAVLPWVILLPVALWAILGLLIALLPQGRGFVQSLLSNPAIAPEIGVPTIPHLVSLVLRIRIGNPWVYLFLAGFLAWVIALLWLRLRPYSRAGDRGTSQGPQPAVERARDVPQSGSVTPDAFALLMIGLALVLVLSVEFFYLRDLFGTRMNTVFKFYYQAWILLALAAAYGLSRISVRSTPSVLKGSAWAVTAVLVIGGLFYTVAAIPSKADNFQGQPTLDGLAYMQRYNPADYAAIEWIRTHVPPTAVVVEATGGSYSPEGAGRVSMATGNPTLLGWDFHEMQWRGTAYDELAAGRPDALTQIYRTARPEELPALLDKWGVDYVYVGALEREKYKVSDATLARFDLDLTRVYDNDGVVIFAR